MSQVILDPDLLLNSKLKNEVKNIAHASITEGSNLQVMERIVYFYSKINRS